MRRDLGRAELGRAERCGRWANTGKQGRAGKIKMATRIGPCCSLLGRAGEEENKLGPRAEEIEEREAGPQDREKESWAIRPEEKGKRFFIFKSFFFHFVFKFKSKYKPNQIHI